MFSLFDALLDLVSQFIGERPSLLFGALPDLARPTRTSSAHKA